MVDLDRRVRVAGALLRRLGSVTRMSEADIARAQRAGPPPAALRWLFGAPVDGVDVSDRQVALPEGERRVRVYRPRAAASAPRPLVVNFHGGGFVLGTVEGSDWVCSAVSAAADVVVVSVDYRLAPSHPFPAAAEDAYAATVWAAEHAAALDVDPTRLAVMGDSAGGNLAAVVALLARDRGGPELAAQILIYPTTDLTDPGALFEAHRDTVILSAPEMVVFRDHYLGAQLESSWDPRASPALAPDHRGLPAALVQVAEHDPLRDDGTRYAALLRAAGVPVRFTEYLGAPHGYVSFPGICRSARQAVHEIAGELRERFAVPTPLQEQPS